MSRHVSPSFGVVAQVRRSVITAIALGVFVVFGASPASAQSPSASRMSGVSFNTISADDTAQTSTPAQGPQAQAQHESKPQHGGIGIGVKGGLMFGKLGTSGGGGTVFQQRAGYQVGLFIGGNRNGVVGVSTEITYIKRNAQAQGNTTPSSSATALEIPLLLTLNAGSRHVSGANLYFLVGPAIDINMTKFSTAFVSNTTSYDLNGVAGLGVEYQRVMFEFRYNHSFRSVARTLSSNTPVNMQSFVLLLGIRFN